MPNPESRAMADGQASATYLFMVARSSYQNTQFVPKRE